MKRYLLSIGSSLSDREKNLSEACFHLQFIGDIEALSDIYYSEPYGGVAKNQFYNQSLILRTDLAPFELLDEIHIIESQMGRVRNIRWEDRIIDIDIILYKNDLSVDVLIDSYTIKIPHPQMSERDFVVIPSLQIASDWIHPLYGKSLAQVFSDFKPDINSGFLTSCDYDIPESVSLLSGGIHT